MSERHASRTALGVAFLRAVHQLLDTRPLILDDPVALALIGPSGEESIREHADGFQTPGARALRTHVVIRSRFAEDRLALAVGRGVTQCVILGAGYDTFAFRQPEWARALRITEVDHPATQELKRAQLASVGIETPANVRFAAVDFERESLEDGLRRHGIAFDEPTFFSWLGVTMYLTSEAVDAVFRTVASFPASSEIVFTFAQPPVPDDLSGDVDGSLAERAPTFAERAASIGEPWLTYMKPDAILEKLHAFGFASVEFLTGADAMWWYVRGRADALPAPSRTTVASAIR